jgi:hypothetical protein
MVVTITTRSRVRRDYNRLRRPGSRKKRRRTVHESVIRLPLGRPRKLGQPCPPGTERNHATSGNALLIALSDQSKSRTPTRLALGSVPCIAHGDPYLQCRPARRIHLGAGIRTGAHSPVPRDRIPQPYPESGQGRRPTMGRLRTRLPCHFRRPSSWVRVRGEWT